MVYASMLCMIFTDKLVIDGVRNKTVVYKNEYFPKYKPLKMQNILVWDSNNPEQKAEIMISELI